MCVRVCACVCVCVCVCLCGVCVVCTGQTLAKMKNKKKRLQILTFGIEKCNCVNCTSWPWPTFWRYFFNVYCCESTSVRASVHHWCIRRFDQWGLGVCLDQWGLGARLGARLGVHLGTCLDQWGLSACLGADLNARFGVCFGAGGEGRYTRSGERNGRRESGSGS